MRHLGVNICENSSVILLKDKFVATWLGVDEIPHEALYSASEALNGEYADTICICSNDHDPERLMRFRRREIAWLIEQVSHHKVSKLNRDFTMHDALAWTGRYYNDSEYYLVANNHGSYGEVISLYRINGGFELIYRLHGLNNSIGMLEQMTLAHIGYPYTPLYSLAQQYKNQLGEILLEKMVNKTVEYVVRQRLSLNQKYDPLYNSLAFGTTKHFIEKLWQEIERFGYKNGVSLSELGYSRCIAIIAQLTIEAIIVNIIEQHGVTSSLTCIGSVFANTGIRDKLKALTIPTDNGAIGIIYYNDRSIKL